MNAPATRMAAIGPVPATARFALPHRQRARPANRPTPLAARHLVLAYRPRWQSIEDLNAIARHVSDIDPSIRTFIVPTTLANHVTSREIAERPTLVCSPGRMLVFKPPRGKVYEGWPMPKLDELRRLAKAGVPVPKTAVLTPGVVLDPAEWGEFVIVKPTDIGTSSHGRGIQLMRTRRVRYIAPADYPPGHPGRLGPMVAQQYVNTGEWLQSYRVTTLFGEPLMALLHTSEAPRVDLTASDEEIEKAPMAIQGVGARHTEFIDAPDVVRLARAAHAALPEIPLKGCDILRDATTGKLMVIELNSGGNTWHFSSRFLAERRRAHGPEFELRRRQQFDAMRAAARVLVERTNAEAQ